MKKLLSSLLTVTFLSILFVVSAGNKARAQDVTVSYQTFYDELSPYGQWVYDPEYGNVWVPNEDGDFRPYGSRGRWAMTEYGNTWVSDDPWGWACYHYGRWTYNNYYGWIWVPGYEWAPAWVSWRYGGGYCGWAPLSPGISIGSSYGCPDSWWVFVGPQYLYRTDYYHYWRGPRYNNECLRRTSWYNNVYTDNYSHVRYNYGPRSSAIERYTHQPVQVFNVSRSNRPGAQPVQQNTVSIYRPNINRNSVSTSRPTNVIQAPRNVGRPEQQSELTPSRQPAFRQEVVRHNTENPRNTGVVGPRNMNNQTTQPGGVTQPRVDNRNDVRNNQTEPARGTQPRVDNRNNQPEPARNTQQPRFDNRNTEPPRNNPQVQPNRPEPQRFEPSRQEPQRAQPQRQEEPRAQPQPQRQEPPRQQPQPQRQEQPRFQPQPQRQDPPRQQPQPQRQEQPRPQPQPQQPRAQPQPQPQPQRQAPNQEQRGGRR